MAINIFLFSLNVNHHINISSLGLKKTKKGTFFNKNLILRKNFFKSSFLGS